VGDTPKDLVVRGERPSTTLTPDQSDGSYAVLETTYSRKFCFAHITNGLRPAGRGVPAAVLFPAWALSFLSRSYLQSK